MNELRREFEKRNYNFTTLSQDVVIRWHSIFKMLSRLEEALEVVNVVLMKITNGRDLVFTPSEQVVLSEIFVCLRPFYELTEKLSGSSYTTMSLIIPYTTGIFRELDNLSLSLETTAGKNLAARLKTNCTSYLLPYESRTCFALAILLDPRFKNTAFMNQTRAEQAVTNLKASLKEMYDAEMAKGMQQIKLHTFPYNFSSITSG